MKFIATTTEQMLETVLLHLHATGWQQVDLEKLVDAYNAFRYSMARRCVYRLRSGPDYRARLRQAIESDITGLEARGWAQRSVSRVWLTDEGKKQAAVLKLNQAQYGSLTHHVSATFPSRA